jgi:hypothetical protein
MFACIQLGLAHSKRLERALAILTGGEIDERREASPPPEPDAETVESYLSRLSRKEDQFAYEWDDTDQCYYISICGGALWCGIEEGDEMAAKQKTPEPGDLIIVPSGGTRFYLGYYVASDREFVSLQREEGLRRVPVSSPPLVVTRIRRDGSDV